MSSYRYAYGADGAAHARSSHAQLQTQVPEKKNIMSHAVSVQILRGGAQSEYTATHLCSQSDVTAPILPKKK